MADRLLKPPRKNTSGWMKGFVIQPAKSQLDKDMEALGRLRIAKGMVDHTTSLTKKDRY